MTIAGGSSASMPSELMSGAEKGEGRGRGARGLLPRPVERLVGHDAEARPLAFAHALGDRLVELGAPRGPALDEGVGAGAVARALHCEHFAQQARHRFWIAPVVDPKASILEPERAAV